MHTILPRPVTGGPYRSSRSTRGSVCNVAGNPRSPVARNSGVMSAVSGVRSCHTPSEPAATGRSAPGLPWRARRMQISFGFEWTALLVGAAADDALADQDDQDDGAVEEVEPLIRHAR